MSYPKGIVAAFVAMTAAWMAGAGAAYAAPAHFRAGTGAGTTKITI